MHGQKQTTNSDSRPAPGDPTLAARLAREIEGEVLFDPFSRGRYSTDASLYQIEPLGIAIPKHEQDVRRILDIAADADVPVIARGGGTSQNGQAIGRAIVVDTSRHMDAVLDVDTDARTAAVQPGIALDTLNKVLKPQGLQFAVDPSTSSRATIGGMVGNNSSGAHSIRYGITADNVRAIDALLADGTPLRFAELPNDLNAADVPARYRDIMAPLLDLARAEADEIAARFPNVQRRVGGYNIDALTPAGRSDLRFNAARLLVGSEGTLAFSTRIELALHPLPRFKVLGVCHFPSFYASMDAVQHIVAALDPDGVELIDRHMIGLARDIAMFRPMLERFINGNPAAVLVVEFAGDDRDAVTRKLRDLDALMGDLGFPGSVVEALDSGLQAQITTVRKAGLNIIMSMKGDGKPISFIEDCAVPLPHLADYTARLNDVFERHGTIGTFYAHASVGCLHVRPIINMKEEGGAATMRAIAEETFELVREYKGSHSGEHGDGISRSEFHESMFGPRMVAAFETVKDRFDPDGRFNPGKIVRAPRMDDRDLFRFKPGYAPAPLDSALDWSDWGGFTAAAEQCNNNGACRKFDVDVMCPSFRVTREEKHSTRGRANTLRLALSGQLGPDALTSESMKETMALCVGCKACKRECPTGVDMARMKIEYLYQWTRKHGVKLREGLIAYLPRYAPWAARIAPLMNLSMRLPGAALILEKVLGFSRDRQLPLWAKRPFRSGRSVGPEDGPEVVLFADTFDTYYEPGNLSATLEVLTAAGYRVHMPIPADGARPMCCGRTFLAAGLVDQARAEARRTLETLRPFVERGVAVVGLEPSCLLTLRDEFTTMLPGAESAALAGRAFLLEEFLAAEADAGRFAPDLGPVPYAKALLHGHCHQKAFDAVKPIEKVLALIPDLTVETVESSCCGMAGAFGYAVENQSVSTAMAELSLLPAVRAAGNDTVVIADGTSCRQQIDHGTGRKAVHVAELLASALHGRGPSNKKGRQGGHAE